MGLGEAYELIHSYVSLLNSLAFPGCYCLPHRLFQIVGEANLSWPEQILNVGHGICQAVLGMV